MSNELVGRCWLIDFPTSAMKLVMMKLADCADDDGSNVFPSVAYVAAETQLSTRSVSDQIAALRECGLVVDKRDEHGNRVNRTSVLREINIDLMAAVSDKRVRGKPRLPSSHVIAQVEIEVPAGAYSVMVPGALAPSAFRYPAAGGVHPVWAIVPRATPATDAEAEPPTPATGAGAPLQQLQGTPATGAVHPCDSCQQPIHYPSTDSSPSIPGSESGSEDFSKGWASGWSDTAIDAARTVAASPRVGIVATVFIAEVRGVLMPPAGVDGAAYVRQLANRLGDFDAATLAATAAVMIDNRGVRLPGAGDVAAVARTIVAERAAVAHRVANVAAVPVHAASPDVVARWPAIRERLGRAIGSDRLRAWFDGVAPVDVDGGHLVLAAPSRHVARWIDQNFADAVVAAASHDLPAVRGCRVIVGGAA